MSNLDKTHNMVTNTNSLESLDAKFNYSKVKNMGVEVLDHFQDEHIKYEAQTEDILA